VFPWLVEGLFIIIRGIYLLGYLPAHNRIYVADKDMNVFSYALALTVVEYQTAILRGDMVTAEAMLPTIPSDQRNRIARFLEAQGEALAFQGGNYLTFARSQGARALRFH
jgi:coatomer subunit beta'